MRISETDILSDRQELKTMPFSTPAGYFDSLKRDFKESHARSGHGFGRQVTYLAVAAMFALLVAAGGFFLLHQESDDFTMEDYIVFSEDMTNTIFYTMDEQYADALTEDDIIEYLIYTNTNIDDLY